MIPCNTINQTIECLVIFILLILLASTHLRKREQGMRRLYMLTVGLHIFNTLGDLYAWMYTGRAGKAMLLCTTVGNFFTYFIGPLAYLGFVFTVYGNITGRTISELFEKDVQGMAERLFLGVIVGITAVNLGLFFYNFFNPVLYRITAQNEFIWGVWRNVPDNLVMLQFILLLPPVLLYKQSQWKQSLSMYLLYAGIPISAILVESVYPTLMLLYPAVTLSLLLIYGQNYLEGERSLMEKEVELSDSKVRLLMAQIQPHFIFNSLQAIQELCVENPEQAQKSVHDFSKYLRGNLDALSCTHLIPFEKELSHIQAYIALEQADPGRQFEMVYDLETTGFQIPALSVQPMVENAVKHGMTSCTGRGKVILRTIESAKEYKIEIIDNGKGIGSGITQKQKERQRVGLENVRTRLEVQCKGTLELESNESGVTVIIHIPKKLEG